MNNNKIIDCEHSSQGFFFFDENDKTIEFELNKLFNSFQISLNESIQKDEFEFKVFKYTKCLEYFSKLGYTHVNNYTTGEYSTIDSAIKNICLNFPTIQNKFISREAKWIQ